MKLLRHNSQASFLSFSWPVFIDTLLIGSRIIMEIIDLTNESDNEYKQASYGITNKRIVSDFSESKWQPFYLTRVSGISSYNNECSLGMADLLYFSEKNPIERIFLMNFMVDMDWLISACPILVSVPTLCLFGVESNSSVMLDTIITGKVDLGAETYGSHHSKIMCVFYRSGLRLVIMTANLIKEDFEYRTQGIYVQDFPLKSMCAGGSGSLQSDFENSLINYLQRVKTISNRAQLSLREHINLLASYSFCSAEVVLIPSVPGRHTEGKQRWGILKLAAALSEEPLPTGFSSEDSPLVMQISSIGSMGKSGEVMEQLVSHMSLHSTSANRKLSLSQRVKEQKKAKVEIVWPSVNCVRRSLQVC
jgi:tyrosyl-DNA phosphodiesterase-1